MIKGDNSIYFILLILVLIDVLFYSPLEAKSNYFFSISQHVTSSSNCTILQINNIPQWDLIFIHYDTLIVHFWVKSMKPELIHFKQTRIYMRKILPNNISQEIKVMSNAKPFPNVLFHNMNASKSRIHFDVWSIDRIFTEQVFARSGYISLTSLISRSDKNNLAEEIRFYKDRDISINWVDYILYSISESSLLSGKYNSNSLRLYYNLYLNYTGHFYHSKIGNKESVLMPVPSNEHYYQKQPRSFWWSQVVQMIKPAKYFALFTFFGNSLRDLGRDTDVTHKISHLSCFREMKDWCIVGFIEITLRVYQFIRNKIDISAADFPIFIPAREFNCRKNYHQISIALGITPYTDNVTFCKSDKCNLLIENISPTKNRPNKDYFSALCHLEFNPVLVLDNINYDEFLDKGEKKVKLDFTGLVLIKGVVIIYGRGGAGDKGGHRI